MNCLPSRKSGHCWNSTRWMQWWEWKELLPIIGNLEWKGKNVGSILDSSTFCFISCMWCFCRWRCCCSLPLPEGVLYIKFSDFFQLPFSTSQRSTPTLHSLLPLTFSFPPTTYFPSIHRCVYGSGKTSNLFLSYTTWPRFVQWKMARANPCKKLTRQVLHKCYLQRCCVTVIVQVTLHVVQLFWSFCYVAFTSPLADQRTRCFICRVHSYIEVYAFSLPSFACSSPPRNSLHPSAIWNHWMGGGWKNSTWM